jgi:hypothetical protein
MDTLNLAGVQPEARPVVEAASAVYLRHTQPWLIGLVLHGSALKGGFIPGCSDVDMQLYLEDGAFTALGQLPLEVGLVIQRDLAQIEPAPFQYIQRYALPPRLPAQRVGPIPGAYRLLVGILPVPEATEKQLQMTARMALERLQVPPGYIAEDLLQAGGGKLERLVRLVCTDVWPILYQLLALQEGNAIRVWGLPKDRAIGLVASHTAQGQAIRAFYADVSRFYAVEASVGGALRVISSGVEFPSAAKSWWAEHMKMS